jgi:saccharopine dehydrogenase-like NADP-dependent oxidoreductase
LQKEKTLVIGLGEVGKAIFDLLEESGKFEVHGVDLDKTKMKDIKQTAIPSKTARASYLHRLLVQIHNQHLISS